MGSTSAPHNRIVGAGKDQGDPCFRYFRALPQQLRERPPLASSLQHLEQCFDLVALGRFPGALVACVTAWESALKAWKQEPPEIDTKLVQLLSEVRAYSPSLRMFGQGLDRVRQTRNTIMHHGFSPKDDNECASLLIETGWPFLEACYAALFDFYLDWRTIRPGSGTFSDLTPVQLDKVGLLFEVSEHLHVAAETYREAARANVSQATQSFIAFGHYLRWSWKQHMLTETEEAILTDAEVVGVRHTAESELERELCRLFKSENCEPWKFDCPICHGDHSVVAELDLGALQSKRIHVRRCACVGCQLVVPTGAVYLADKLLHETIQAEKADILREAGIG